LVGIANYQQNAKLQNYLDTPLSRVVRCMISAFYQEEFDKWILCSSGFDYFNSLSLRVFNFEATNVVGKIYF
jgi:hypothetical protein